MNCVICGNIMVNDVCEICGYQNYNNSNKIYSEEKSINKEIYRINDFFKFFQNLKDLNFYINRKYFQGTIESYLDIYNLVKNLKDTNTLSKFSKDNEYSENNFNRFLDLYHNFQKEIDKLNDDYVERKLISEKEYLDNILKVIDPTIKLDDDQRRAILTDEDYNLIIAGAGAGKTTTVAAKVKYLVDKEGIDPKDILVVSFTNKAVDELKEKIQALGIDPIISTFHRIGNKIIIKHSNEVSKILSEKFWLLSKFFKEEILGDMDLLKKLIFFFGCYLKVPDELLNFDTIEQYYSHLERSDFSTLRSNIGEYNRIVMDTKSKQNITINSEFLKSNQEVQIANFLYLNKIEYTYEKPYKYKFSGMTRKYTPDFHIIQDGKEFYIEHFGVSENGKNGLYNNNQLKQYLKNIWDKKKLHNEMGTNLICTYSSYNDGRDLLTHLKEELEKNNIRLERRSDQEVFNKITKLDKDKYFYSFTFLTERFLGLFKTNGYTEDDFTKLRTKSNNPRSLLFLDIMEQAYLYYQNNLRKNGAVDFEDMINEAAKILKTKENLKYNFKYVIVDEYQDISRQRFNLAKEISSVSDAKVIAVGDDWQSIFAFAGSDVTLFTHFCKIFGYGKELKITRTYRNAQEVIDVAGNFVQKNDSQIKKKLISDKHIQQPIVVYTYQNKGKKSGILEAKAENINDTIRRIIGLKENKDNVSNHSILLIGRYGFDGQNLSRTKYFDYDTNTSTLKSKEFPEANLTFLTAHSSKGLGYDDVIIINADNTIYGFPAQIEDDPILKLVKTEEEKMDFSEERRLFYVALTRTKNRVFIITPAENPSRFVLELLDEYENVQLEGTIERNIKDIKKERNYCPVCGFPIHIRKDPNYGTSMYICMNEPELCGFVTNNMNGDKRGIHFCDKCDGYMKVKYSKKTTGYFYGCSNYIGVNKGCQNTEKIES